MSPDTTCSPDPRAEKSAEHATVSVLTSLMGIVVGLTFLFGFGNVLTLGLRLGVPIWIAPLVAPAVDLSVVGLLIGTRYLPLHGGPHDTLRSARRLLIFASTVTLALNIAEPLSGGEYGKAAFDAVGPLLLIGWSEVGPDLLQALRVSAVGAEDSKQSARPAVEAPATTGHGSHPSTEPTDHTPVGGATRPRRRQETAHELLRRARTEDQLHWQQHHRPISAESLRKRLHVGAGTARDLVADLRTDTHARLRLATVSDQSPPQSVPRAG